MTKEVLFFRVVREVVLISWKAVLHIDWHFTNANDPAYLWLLLVDLWLLVADGPIDNRHAA